MLKVSINEMCLKIAHLIVEHKVPTRYPSRLGFYRTGSMHQCDDLNSKQNDTLHV